MDTSGLMLSSALKHSAMEEAQETREAEEVYKALEITPGPSPALPKAVAIAREETLAPPPASCAETPRDAAFLTCRSCWRLFSEVAVGGPPLPL